MTAAQVPFTLDEVLRSRSDHADPQILLRRIAREYGVSVERIRSHTRAKYLDQARNAAYAALRAIGLSYPEIGELLDRNHTTVLAGVRKFQADREKNRARKAAIKEFETPASASAAATDTKEEAIKLVAEKTELPVLAGSPEK